MKKIAIALMMVCGMSFAGSVLACPGKGHKTQTETTAPAAPTPAPAK